MVGHKKPVTVLIVDDHPLIREGIAAVAGGYEDISVVGEASNGLEAVRLYRTMRPDVTLMDVQMPELNGIGAISSIISEFPQACIAVLTTYRGDVRALHAIKAGARGYLLKSTLRHELIETIRALAAGKRRFPRRSRRSWRLTSSRTGSPKEKFRCCNRSPRASQTRRRLRLWQ